LHGAGSPASALWDIESGDYSVMRRLACAGFDVYTVDVRGFGGSTIPPALLQPAENAPPAVRATDVMPDVKAALRYATKQSGVERVDLVGWSWGCVVAGMAAGRFADQIRRLILFAPVYDRKWPSRHKTEGAWRSEHRQLYFDYFDAGREERAVLQAHVDALFRFAGPNQPVRLPNGPYMDLYGPEAPVWSAAKVIAPTLIVRGEKDPASKMDAAYRLFQALTEAPLRRYVELGDAGHFAFRTRRYRALQTTIVDFLAEKL
ncbi:MAG: alpha/beta fold hydrolase, partial [Myxococcota bacterium]